MRRSPTITARRFHELPSRSSLLWKKSERPSKLHGVHSQKNWVKLPSGGGCGSLAPTGRTPQLRSRVPLQLSSTAIRSPSTDSQPDHAIAGKVGYIASVAEFTPKTVQTEELRSSLVYEVRVVVQDTQDALRLGQPATVRLAADAAS